MVLETTSLIISFLSSLAVPISISLAAAGAIDSNSKKGDLQKFSKLTNLEF
jgi:hypothetical protein